VGIFGGSGVGKSTLIGMMARGTAADMTVLALVGERGREVGEFLEVLGEEGLRRAVSWCLLPISRRSCAFARRWRQPRLPSILQAWARMFCSSSIRSRALPWRSARLDWRRASRLPRRAIRPPC
jgi:hypothetical protein